MNNHQNDHGLPVNQVLCGDAIEILKSLPPASVDAVVTSPPYWGLRTYGTMPQVWGGSMECEHEWRANLKIWHSDRGDNSHKEVFDRSFQSIGTESRACSKCDAWRGELGLEPYFFQYISHLCDVFDEVKRVLKGTGTLWVNLGDTYGGAGRLRKSLCQIPSRFAIEMCSRSWILRNELIWWKPNCMPSSAKDRFTIDFEKIFFFSKSEAYFFEPQYEPLQPSSLARLSQDIAQQAGTARAHGGMKSNGPIKALGNPAVGRNKRCVWRVTPKPFSEAHFAVYPPELVETPLRAGCPEFICRRCGTPRRKIYDGKSTGAFNVRVRDVKEGRIKHVDRVASPTELSAYDEKVYGGSGKRLVGYTDCGCGAGFESGVVLDPFMGSGTTAIVALALNRHFIGIELNPDYVQMARRRISQLFGNGNQTQEK